MPGSSIAAAVSQLQFGKAPNLVLEQSLLVLNVCFFFLFVFVFVTLPGNKALKR